MILAKAQERRSDLRNTSILEVVIAVILILLVFIYQGEVEFRDAETDFSAQIKKLEISVEEFEKKLAASEREKRAITAEKEKLEEKNRWLQRMIEGSGGSDEAKIGILIGQMDEAKAEIAELKSELARSEAKIKDLLATRKGSGKGGSDSPRCLSKFGPVQWLMNIKVEEAGYLVSFPLERPVLEDLLGKVDGLKNMYEASSRGVALSKSQFEKWAGGIYRWSTAQKPACRFRVNVWDSEHYNKYDRRRIERYVYPREILK